MKVLGITCNHCGAPLEVGARAKFATCGYCDSRLRIVRTGSAAHTEVLEELGERTKQIADDVEIIKLQNEIERLDRQWTSGRERLMTQDKHGRYSVPTRGGSIVMAIAFALFGVVWVSMAGGMGAPLPFILVGLVVVVIGIVQAVLGVGKAKEYERRQAAYRAKRRKAMRELRDVKRD